MFSGGITPMSTFSARFVARSIRMALDKAMTVLIVVHIAIQALSFTITISSILFHKPLNRPPMRLTRQTNVTWLWVHVHRPPNTNSDVL